MDGRMFFPIHESTKIRYLWTVKYPVYLKLRYFAILGLFARHRLQFTPSARIQTCSSKRLRTAKSLSEICNVLFYTCGVDLYYLGTTNKLVVSRDYKFNTPGIKNTYMQLGRSFCRTSEILQRPFSWATPSTCHDTPLGLRNPIPCFMVY